MLQAVLEGARLRAHASSDHLEILAVHLWPQVPDSEPAALAFVNLEPSSGQVHVSVDHVLNLLRLGFASIINPTDDTPLQQLVEVC